jgi:hypothetical protein
MPSQIWMQLYEAGQSLANGRSSYVNDGLLAGILTQRRWDMDLGHG